MSLLYRLKCGETTGGRLHATSGVIGCLATLYAGVFTDHIRLPMLRQMRTLLDA